MKQQGHVRPQRGHLTSFLGALQGPCRTFTRSSSTAPLACFRGDMCRLSQYRHRFLLKNLLCLPISCSFLQCPSGTTSTHFFLPFWCVLGAYVLCFFHLRSQQERNSSLKRGSFKQCLLPNRLITTK